MEDTEDESTHQAAGDGATRPQPGVVVVFAAGRPVFRPIAVGETPIAVGRDATLAIDDARLSRRHAELRLAGGSLQVRDLGSRNGSARDGRAAGPEFAPFEVLRLGDSVLLASDDVGPLRSAAFEHSGDVVVGPRLRAVFAAVASAARGDRLHLTGETGTGKELAAREFHRCGPAPAQPFIAVNCASVPAELAERLLFGARKGAFTGASADATGYLQAADGGTLFLDELGELPLEVQAKLLRVLETSEVLPLGATRPVPVRLRVVSATHADLRAEVAAGRFRKDLLFRLGTPAVALPALRQRREDVPWLIAHKLGPQRPHVSLIEAALLRPWPGNVRELVAEVAAAARRASDAGADKVRAEHLADGAGRAELVGANAAGAAVAEAGSQPGPGGEAQPSPRRRQVEQALARAGGNVSQAARELDLHRTQLRRIMIAEGLLAPPSRKG